MAHNSAIDRVADAFKRKDYRTAARLLTPLLKSDPDEPWVQLYAARLHELSGKPEIAEPIYRQLLRNTTNPNPRILAQARQGLQRLENQEKSQRQAAIAQARQTPENQQPGVLVLEPVAPEHRATAIPAFARILGIDPYSARLQLPSRGWRLYRVGPLAELKIYATELRSQQIPAFWAAIADVQALKIFRVHYWQSVAPQSTVVCENAAGQPGSLTFAWDEVARRVVGQLPVFESVVDLDARGQVIRKDTAQDFVQVCDLHLPQRGCILRLCDVQYQFPSDRFPQGVNFAAAIARQQRTTVQPTRRTHWNALLEFLNRRLPDLEVWDGFTGFAPTAIDQSELLGRLDDQIRLIRREEILWDPAFHLYSCLAFLRDRT